VGGGPEGASWDCVSGVWWCVDNSSRVRIDPWFLEVLGEGVYGRVAIGV
jgi:hypothetical protein